MIEHWCFPSEIFLDGLCGTYWHNPLFKCSATKFTMSKINLRYIYPFPLYFPSHPKKKKKNRTGKHISYFNTVQPTLLWSSINPKYFSVISSHLLIPKFRLHSTLLYYFNSILTRRVTLLKSMPHTETQTSSTQNSSVVLHHSLDNPLVFPTIHRVGHKSLFMAVNGIFVLVLVSETWSLYDYEASSVFAPFLTLYVSVEPKRVDSWSHWSIVNSCLQSYCSEIRSYPAVLIHLIIANSCNFSLVPHFFFRYFMSTYYFSPNC